MAFQLIFFGILFHNNDFVNAKMYFTVFIYVLTGLVLFILLFRSNDPRPELYSFKAAKPQQKSKTTLILSLIILIALLFYLAFALHGAAPPEFWNKGGNLFTRLFPILTFLIMGWLCDKTGWHTIMFWSIAMIIAALILQIATKQALAAFFSIAISQASLAAYDISIKVLFFNLALRFQRKMLIIAAGFIVPLLLQPTGIFLCHLIHPYGFISIFVIAVLISIASIPLILMLFEKLRETNMQSVKEDLPADDSPANGTKHHEKIADFAAHYALTNREMQVLELVLYGQSLSEISQNLYITERTVKAHVSNLLKKTSTKNRTQLISYYYQSPLDM
ncbi:helix-turn-helix transcriptional regulator [Syntrophomonas palmitatica]|uniref:helix-turn-helix transcriptional regulator n=1 Tax=Syntrophomonas palmitatica TaxID=402877 RepID=UPI0006D06521|nr:helix-turn-helix transcriptional regulator [Syntrophomonas palmitatica]